MHLSDGTGYTILPLSWVCPLAGAPGALVSRD
jgi:rubredoxin